MAMTTKDFEPEPEVEQEEKAINPEEYNKGIVKENGTLLDKFIFSRDRSSAKQKIKPGDIVRITFLGAGEEGINVNQWNPVWEMDETISVMGENYYFEVVVNEKRAYYGKWADYRYTKESDTMGGGVTLTETRTCITEKEVMGAFQNFEDWLDNGATENNYWHGLYKKTEFPEKISYGMPGEEKTAPVAEAAWKVGEVIEEGDGVFAYDGIRYEVEKGYEYEGDKRKAVSTLKVLPLKGEFYSGKVAIPEIVTYHRRKLKVTEIDRTAFDNCPELTELFLPRTISHFFGIGGCHKLERITVADGNPDYCSVDGIVYSARWGKKGVYPILQCYPFAHGDHFVVPDFVQEIAARAFSGCRMLKSIVLSNSVTCINDFAFQNCDNLESVTWGTGLESIWIDAFENCTALKSIVFPESVKHVHSNAFRGCSNIESITFAKGKYFDLYSLPKELFPWGKEEFTLDGICYKPQYDYKREGEALLVVTNFPQEEIEANIDSSVQTISIPAKIEHYGYVYEVSGCNSSFGQFPSLKRLELPSTIKEVDISIISTLQEVVVDDANTEFSSDDGLLLNKQKNMLMAVPRGRDIKKFVIPEGVEVIAEKACNRHPYIEEVVIPDSTTVIEKEAFASCGSLHDVHLGKGVQKICIAAFAYTAIERIVLPPNARFTAHETYNGKTAFYGSKLKAFELDGENELYTVVDGILYIKTQWGLRLKFCPPAFEGHLQIPEGVYEIGKMSCWGCKGIKSVFVPEGVKWIGEEAFSGCENLESVEFDGHIEGIGGWCFSNCNSLKEIDCIGVKRIEDNAFYGDKELKLILPYALESKRAEFEKFMAR